MPNGGSDCCGTCPFNSANAGGPGRTKRKATEEAECRIRHLAIDNPYWTYCANHPHHNPDGIEVPIGPVYVADDYPYARRVLEKSPDSDIIRRGLLNLLEQMEETPSDEYPTPTKLDEEVIKQLMEFREPRAAPTLRRIIRFDPLACPRENSFARNRVPTVALAVEALATIEGDRALDELSTAVRFGLPEGHSASRPAMQTRPDIHEPSNTTTDHGGQSEDPLAAIRYHAVLGLKHCGSEPAKALLRAATSDPHPEVAAFAREVLATIEADQ